MEYLKKYKYLILGLVVFIIFSFFVLQSRIPALSDCYYIASHDDVSSDKDKIRIENCLKFKKENESSLKILRYFINE